MSKKKRKMGDKTASINVLMKRANEWLKNPTTELQENIVGLTSSLDKNNLQKLKIRLSSLLGMFQNDFKEQETYIAITEQEWEKSKFLIHKMFPGYVVEYLFADKFVKPKIFENVTIFFSDIVGFTKISEEISAKDVLLFLHELYAMLDKLIEGFDVTKIETIGDSYMVASGISEPCRGKFMNVKEMANMSLAFLDAIKKVDVPNRPGKSVEIRIGMHTGPCAAGVVGTAVPRFSLFGSTVNIASRMESTGLPMKIQISDTFTNIVEAFGEFCIENRGEVTIKGKGTMKTSWLLGLLSEEENKFLEVA